MKTIKDIEDMIFKHFLECDCECGYCYKCTHLHICAIIAHCIADIRECGEYH